MEKILPFDWAVEGGGSKVYRITENGKERIVQHYSHMDFDENDIDIWRQGEVDHESFKAYWQNFTLKENWIRCHPVFIHKDYKAIIRESLETIDVSGLSECDSMSVDNWAEKLYIKGDVCLYQAGNKWQRDRYAFMSDYNRKAGITEFGIAKKGDQKYFHIITAKDRLHNFLDDASILNVVEQRFERKAGDLQRVLTNTVASQPCCFNLFAPLQRQTALANKLFSHIMGKQIQVQQIEIEFTPNEDESLGDQSTYGGTDADVAVFYSYDQHKCGVVLIEFKYIESEFSVCTSYRQKNGKEKDGIRRKDVRPVCDSREFYEQQVLPYLDKSDKPLSPDCGYLNYNNWQLLSKSDVFDQQAIKAYGKCPFRFSLQQLWRNLLLAENVVRVRNLDEFQFWVISPSQNEWLWQDKGGGEVEAELRKILTPYGNSIFFRKDIKKDFVYNLKTIAMNDWEREWICKFDERYMTVVHKY